METQIAIAFFEATAIFVLTLALNKNVGAWDSSVGAIVLLGPLFVIFISGMLHMLNADSSSSQAIANSTISSVISYVTLKLPGEAISDMAGAVVGTIGGFIVAASQT